MNPRWSEPERTLAANLRAQGLAHAEIAAQLPGRTAAAVKRQIAKLAPERLERTINRRINAQPWEPLPGMLKRTCVQCRFTFAAPSDALDRTARCPDCALGRREQRLERRRIREQPNA